MHVGPIKRFTSFLRPAETGFIGLVSFYILISAAIAVFSGYAADFRPFMYMNAGVLLTCNFLMVYVLYRLMRAGFLLFKHRPLKPGAYLLADLKSGPFNPDVYKRALPVFGAFFFFFSTFTSMKMLIPRIHPFRWDEFMMKADRFFHFGFDPWAALQPVLGYPVVTMVISFVYILWLPVFFLVLYWQLFRLKDPATRMRFFYTFVLSWAINGTFLALTFSSAGPCYFERVTGGDHYVLLMEYLYRVNEQREVYALHTQDLLWTNLQRSGEIIGGGISAFPSVHVATAFLFVLLGRKTGRKAFIAAIVFFVFILLGSVHLGWHYAVDGYFSILTTCLIWHSCGLFLTRCKNENN